MSVRMKFRLVLLLVICALAAFFVWQRMRSKPVQVLVHPVERGSVERLVANTRAGTLKACRRANLSPGIGGQISLLPVKKGDRVIKGQLLVELWNKDLIAQAELARSEMAAAKARAEAARQQAEIAGRTAARSTLLHQEEAVSDEQLDLANTEAQVRQAEYVAALAAERTSRDRLQEINAEFERTRLVAPFAGIIAEVNGELNEYVTPSPPGIPTPPTVVLLDTECFYVTAPIDEVDAAAIAVGMPVRVSLDAFGERRFEGRVRKIDPYVLDLEKQARTVSVEVDLVSSEDFKNFLTGYSADVEIVLTVRNDTLRIPTRAVLDGQRVFVFNPARKRLKEKRIKPGLGNWEQTEVLSGLSEGELVVLSTDRPGVQDEASAITEDSR